MKIPMLLWSLCLLTISHIFAQPLKTQTVSVFKNGTAFFQKSGKVSSENNSFVLKGDEIPKALFGTLGFITPDQSITSIRRLKKETKKTVPLSNIPELLKENVGKTVRLSGDGQKQWQGEIISVAGQMVSLKADAGWYSLMTNQITGISFVDQPNLEIESNSPEKVLSIDFNKKPVNQSLDMVYLAKDLGWFPNYRLELISETSANLTLKADLVNDGEDLENVEVNFVVGVPNFAYAHFASPMTDDRPLEDILARLSRGSNPDNFNTFSNIASQSISYSIDRNLQSDEITDISNSVEGKEQEDLFFYSLKNITLPKAGRAEFEILKAEIPIEHIYESRLTANYASISFYSQQADNPSPITVNHQIKVNNSTKQPFTTGPALVVKKDGKNWTPISQDRLDYVPTGGHSFLQITTAPDVNITHKEEETGRQENAKRIDKTSYDLVTIKGEAKIKNYKQKAIALNVRRAITGELGKTSEKWLTAPRIQLRGGLNPVTDICWEMKLKAGEEKTITYEYQIYIPR
ncbi:MAG: DUF4139 domain-containing protein [Bacteroidetes bacterium]|nr:DUF4139 domain-containing protein [Bacteroidota bacterium]